jgi:hypothetical protein
MGFPRYPPSYLRLRPGDGLPCLIEISVIDCTSTGYFILGWVNGNWKAVAVSREWTPLAWPARLLL